MKQPGAFPPAPRPVRPTHPAGTYVSCSACGRLLKIAWATRSIICSCGAKIAPAPPPGK